jgi:Spy/CpxP family protein refolding chaperone
MFNRNTIAAFLLGSALVVGAGAFAVDRHANQHSAIDASAHAERMLKHMYVEIDATDAQKAQIEPLVKQAMQDLKPLHTQLHGAHAQALQLLTQATIDRAALESMRAQNMQLADQASKRLVQLVADIGDVLTPAQRQKLADHLGKLHGGGMHHG